MEVLNNIYISKKNWGVIIQYLLFIFGLIIGSFLNVCIYRIPEKKSIVYPGSHCPDCGHSLKWWELIPVLSFIFLKGKCRYCGQKMSWQYPVVEVLTGVIFVLIFNKFNLTFNFYIYALLSSILIIISWIDIRKQIIPDLFTIPGIIFGLVLSIFNPRLTFVSSLLGLLAGGGSLLLIAYLSRGGMGGGDIKLMAMVGAFSGWQIALISIFLGAILGSVVGLFLIIFSDRGLKSRLVFGPFLSAASLLTMLYYQHLIRFYNSIFFGI